MIKQYISFILIFGAFIFGLRSQEVEQKLSGAKSAYKNGKLEDARFALQEALSKIDIVLGNEILALLPLKMGEFETNETGDNVSGTSAGYGGLYVNRSYGGGEGQNSASIQIINDAPMLSAINSLLAMPAIATAGNPDQKRIKVDGYKALMEKDEEEDGTVSYNIQIPLGNSLLTFKCDGFSDEDEVIKLANTIPVSEIVEKTK